MEHQVLNGCRDEDSFPPGPFALGSGSILLGKAEPGKERKGFLVSSFEGLGLRLLNTGPEARPLSRPSRLCPWLTAVAKGGESSAKQLWKQLIKQLGLRCL